MSLFAKGKPKQDKIDHYRPQGEEFDKAYTYDYQSRTDDTEASQKQVTAEKITVSTSDTFSRIEETEKPRYPRHLDVGRIVIEETPEEKREVIKRDVIKRDEVKPKRKDTQVRDELDRRPEQQGKEDVVTVGKLDFSEYHEKPIEFEPLKERTTNIERMGKDRKVSLITLNTNL